MASRVADSNAACAPSASRTTFSPLPPPPYAALMATGQPCSSPKATISLTSSMAAVVPGTASTPASAAASRDEILSPITSIAAGGGPIQVQPASVTAPAKSAFSAKNP